MSLIDDIARRLVGADFEDELAAIGRDHDVDSPDVIAGIATCADAPAVCRWLIARPPTALATGLERTLERGKLRPVARLLVTALVDGARRERDAPSSKAKALPAFARPERLPPLVGASGEAPAAEVIALVHEIAAMPDHPPDAPYTDDSLTKLCRALALGWITHGADLELAWAAHAAALFPDDGTAEDLALLAQELPDVGPTLIDVLVAMNTRVSLCKVLELAKIGNKPLKQRARTAFEAAAKAAGITAHDLADKLIPHDLPIGQPIPDFAKRLEQRMVNGTPMTLLEFAENILQRDAVRTKARGIVFGIVDDAKLLTFAIGRDGLVDSDGEPFELPSSAQVIVVHPVDLPRPLIEKWRAVVPVQPFRQLARKVQRHTTLRAMMRDAQATAGELGYMDTSRVLRLEALGWTRGPVINGQFSRLVRELDGVTVAIDVYPGIELAGGQPRLQRISGVSGRGKGSARAVAEIAREIGTLADP